MKSGINRTRSIPRLLLISWDCVIKRQQDMSNYRPQLFRPLNRASPSEISFCVDNPFLKFPYSSVTPLHHDSTSRFSFDWKNIYQTLGTVPPHFGKTSEFVENTSPRYLFWTLISVFRLLVGEDASRLIYFIGSVTIHQSLSSKIHRISYKFPHLEFLSKGWTLIRLLVMET